MAGQKIVSFFVSLIICSLVGLAVSAFPVHPIPYTLVPSSSAPAPVYYPPVTSGPAMHGSPQMNGSPQMPDSPGLHPVPYPIPSPNYPPESSSPLLAPVSPPLPVPAPIPPSKGVKGAYWPSFTGFPVSSIDTSYFTHLYYAFLLPDPITSKLNITTNDEEMLPAFIATLNTPNSHVKTLLSIGGGGCDPKIFSAIFNSSSSRAVFIQSAIEIARQYGFGGLDLDWEFPNSQEDMSNLGTLYKEWRKALNKEAKVTGRTRLLLTSAVYFASKYPISDVVGSLYPGEAIRRYVDWINPMCYDYHGSWDSVTGQPSALHDQNSNISTSYGIKSWIEAGVPPKNLVMGLPLYAHTWTLKDPNVNGVGAPAVGVGPGNGILIYSRVVHFNSANNATVVYDGTTSSMYSYAGNVWIGYDDPLSVKKKVQFARSYRLGGYFFWALGQDKDWSISRQGMYLVSWLQVTTVCTHPSLLVTICWFFTL
ncbi:hypothetical protein IFM89_037658 [Coptis chinensis]|uniref:GH18 domain-containing protein n=1 Tax=Coptis chinensis TaxID=261450 RepID=A0A835IGN3_9MAGN|nr:hypothetical protein IFM89_037658 [Coptis chinensis]